MTSWPQRSAAGNQADRHNCSSSSMKLINSRPMYMISMVTDSQRIPTDREREREREREISGFCVKPEAGEGRASGGVAL